MKRGAVVLLFVALAALGLAGQRFLSGNAKSGTTEVVPGWDFDYQMSTGQREGLIVGVSVVLDTEGRLVAPASSAETLLFPTGKVVKEWLPESECWQVTFRSKRFTKTLKVYSSGSTYHYSE